MQMIPSFTSGAFINSADSGGLLRVLLDESDYLFSPSSSVDDVSNDIDAGYIVDPDDYKSRFFPVYIRGDYALRGLWGRFNGVVGGHGTEDDPYVISGWEFEGRKFWKRFDRHYGITIENVDKHVVIKNNYIHGWWFTIGGDYVSGGIHIRDCSNISIEYNLITENRKGICSGADTISVTNSIIRFNNISANGYGLVCSTNSHDVVTNNNIFNNYDDGIICNNANAYVAFNTVFSNGEDGIDSIGRDRSLIEYNMIYDNSKDGIIFGGTAGIEAHPIIANNELFSNGRYGVGCYDPTEAVIRNNSIYSNFEDGISCRADADPLIIDNIISSNDGSGIDIVEGKPFIAHNYISDHTYGIHSHGNDPGIQNNVIESNEIGIYIIDHPNLHYNNFENNEYAVYVGFWQSPLINATDNWWNAIDGPSGNGTGSGDPISNYIDYIPWLMEPNPYAGPR